MPQTSIGTRHVVYWLTLVSGLLAAITVLAAGDKPTGREANGATKVLVVTHGPVATQLTTPGSDGHQLGDQRVLTATPIFDRRAREVGRLDAQLLTTSVDYPASGDEVRMTTLNFVFGDSSGTLAGSPDQIFVRGSGFYPRRQGTIAGGLDLVRPIIGGSGRFSGATGSALTEHLGDDSWRHTLRFVLPVRP